jgi:NAD(P)-dependent dehydrogenase (short-subunit alcohol dehydrogenase family)
MPLQPASKSVVITGVSTGIGWGTAKALVAQGWRVFGSVRKQADADRVRSELGANFTPLLFDVTDEPAIARAVQIVEKELGDQGLGGLINNSGIALGGPLLHQPLDEIRKTLEVNVVGLLAVTRAFAPLLGASEHPKSLPGRIINMSSVGGKLAAPFIGAYVASKHAVEGLSASLRRELLLYGIDVIVVGPGAVNTPIWDKSTDIAPYEKTPFFAALSRFTAYFVSQGRQGYSSDVFGEKIARIFLTPHPKVRYSVLKNYFSGWLLPRLLPARAVDRAIGKNTGLLK